MVDQILRWVGDVLIVLSALIGVASVAVHLRVRWWETEMGRHLLAYMSVIGAVLVLSSVKIVLGDSWGFQVLRTVVFAGVPAVMGWRLKLQVQAQQWRRPSRHGRP